jgi:hypothetical protein
MVDMAAATKPSDSAATPRRAAEEPREPHLFRFGLRQLLWFVSGLALLLGAMAMIRGGRAMALGFAAALVAAHVLATFVGTRLRNSSRQIQQWSQGRFRDDAAGVPPARGRLTTAELAALTATPLARREQAPRRTFAALLTGVVGGGFFGATVIPLIAGPDANGAGIALGALSCAIIGAWFALLAAHFYSVARRTWRDANRGSTTAPAPSKKHMFRRVR